MTRKMSESGVNTNKEQLRQGLRNLQAILDGMDELVYVLDPDTYEILFANKKLKELIGKQILGKKCYKVFQNLNQPCTLCTNKYIFGENRGKPYIWKYQDPRNKRWYRCRGKAIEWFRGKSVRLGMAIDVTEHKEVEEKLGIKGTWEKESILDNLVEHVLYEDTAMKILWANKAACESAGLPRRELVGRYCYEVWPKRSKPCPDCPVIKAMETGQAHEVEKTTTDGRSWLIQGHPVQDATGNIVGAVEITLEVTEGKRSAHALLESEERFRLIVENSHDGILIMDDRFRVVYANDELSHILSYSKEEIIGKDFRKFLDEESKSLVRDRCLRRQKGEEVPPRYALKVVRKDGEERDVEIKPTIMRNSQGRVQTVGQILDITERRKAGESLKESEEKYRKRFEEALDAIFVADAETGIIVDCNLAASELVGRERTELVGKHQRILHPPEEVEERFSRTFKRHLKEKEGQTLETQVITKKGEIKEVAIKANMFEVENKRLLQGLFRDITERKKMEKEREHFEKSLSTLNIHGQSLNMADNIKKVLTLTLNAMERTFGFEFADIFLREGNGLRLVAHRGASKVLMLNLPLSGRRGVVVKAARSGEPVFVEDIRKERAYVDAGVEGMLSELAVPIKMGNKVLGVLNVESERLAAFDEKDRELLETLASHTAIAISNLKRQEKLSALNIYGRSLNRTQNMEKICKLTLKAMKKTLGYEYASILMVQGKMLQLVSQRGYPKQLSLDMPLDGEKGITVKAARTGKPILVSDIKKEEAYILGKPNMLSELAVPMKARNEVLGVLNVESERLAAFDEDDKKLLEILASHAAIAISNLRRQEQAKRLARKLEYLMKSTTEIMHGKDTRQRLRIIAKTIRNFGWRRVVISLRDKNLEGTELVTSGLTKEEIKLLLERKASGHVWRQRLGPKFKRFKLGQFYYLPWNEPWIRENVHGVLPEISSDEATTYAGVPSKLSAEEMIDWHPQDMLYAPLRTPGERIVGILSMDDPMDGRRPTKESLAPLEIFLHQAAIVIENAQLIRSLSEATEQLEIHAEQLEQKVEERTLELKKSQEQLLKAQRLAVIGELAGMVGHDLRNPLTSINGATYYLKKRLSSKIDGKMKEMLELVEKNIAYSNKIINDLLDYSREVKLDFTESNARSIVRESLSLVEIPKNVQLIDLTKNKPKIKVDIGKIKRAFVNIIKNGIEAMPKGGTLTIRCRKSDGNLNFVFSDTGMGMSKRTLKKLWTPLFTTKAKGMGFGLPICKRVVEAHGGSISVKSAVGKGTTLTVALRIKPESEGGEKIWVKPLESSLLTMMKT
jgi:PAS domain S-box-containing protein